MFMGTYEHSLDSKGRVIVPSKLRDGLGDSFVVTLGLDNCLYGYPMEQWEHFVSDLQALPGNKEARVLQRHFMSGAALCDVDKQGRILIPTGLRIKAGLEKDVVFTGDMNKINIWSKENWKSIDDSVNVDEIAEHMAELGLSF
jgi:MraZ protein